MARTKFTTRFRRLVANLSDTELGVIMGVSAIAARKMRNGDIKTLKLQAALRLAKQLQISPWYLGGEPEPVARSAATLRKKSSKQKGVGGISSSLAAQIATAQNAPIPDDEMSKLRQRVDRLEASLKKLQSKERAQHD